MVSKTLQGSREQLNGGYIMIIYVLSTKNKFGGELDGGQWLNDKALYDGEWYLYRQEWSDSEWGPRKLNHEDFVKVVNSEWIKNHRNYYGCQVLSDILKPGELGTEYDQFVEHINY